MIKEYIEKVIEKNDLSITEAEEVMNKIMTGEVNNSQISAILVALKSKGESAEEIAGFVKSMRNHSIKIKSDDINIVDVCGTGGDKSGTFNISTAVSFVVAGAGVKVAKHGNRSISSKSGSADVLKELGINVELSPELSEKALNEIGITFLFAPLYHPAMKYAAPVRNELKIRTIFNMLGPLTNPAKTKKQIVGVFNNSAAKVMAKAAKYLGFDKVCFICTENKYDEILLNGETKIFEYNGEKIIKEYLINNESFNLPIANLLNLIGGSPKENSEIILKILRDKQTGDAFNVVTANAALSLYSADYSNDLLKCLSAAEESILSNKAFEKLVDLQKFGEINK